MYRDDNTNTYKPPTPSHRFQTGVQYRNRSRPAELYSRVHLCHVCVFFTNATRACLWTSGDAFVAGRTERISFCGCSASPPRLEPRPWRTDAVSEIRVFKVRRYCHAFYWFYARSSTERTGKYENAGRIVTPTTDGSKTLKRLVFAAPVQISRWTAAIERRAPDTVCRDG